MLNAMEKLFKVAELSNLHGDEEKAYISYTRFFNLLEIAQKTSGFRFHKQKDQLIGLIGGINELNKALDLLESITASLRERYAELEVPETAGHSQSHSFENLTLQSEGAKAPLEKLLNHSVFMEDEQSCTEVDTSRDQEAQNKIWELECKVRTLEDENKRLKELAKSATEKLEEQERRHREQETKEKQRTERENETERKRKLNKSDFPSQHLASQPPTTENPSIESYLPLVYMPKQDEMVSAPIFLLKIWLFAPLNCILSHII